MGDSEGDYMAAMRGSNSKQWQSMQPGESLPKYSTGGGYDGSNPGGGAGAGVCYRCKNQGHWARDCPMAPPAPNPDNPAVPEKQCPCGAGPCAVRTSNTPKNPGRQFYVCPKPQDAGKCNFFEWCDAPATGGNPVAGSGSEQSNAPEMKCPSCNHPCAVLTAKTDKNLGRKFYKCQKTEGCNTFKWCDEFKPGDNTSPASGYGYGGYKSSTGTGVTSGGYGGSYGGSYGGGYNPSPGTGAGYGNAPGYTGYSGFGNSQGMAQPPWNNSGNSGNPGTRPGNCYKCGGAGHYANACPVRR